MEKKWHKANEVLKFRILHLIKENIGLFYLYQVQFSRTLRLCFSELFIKGSVTHPTYHTSLRDSSDGNESDHSIKRTTYLTSIAKIVYAKTFISSRSSRKTAKEQFSLLSSCQQNFTTH